MNAMNLTCREAPAHNAPMQTRPTGFAVAKRMLLVLPLPAVLAGCITVNAPDKPIVIELNINIRQEVLYKIENDVEQAVEENSGIF